MDTVVLFSTTGRSDDKLRIIFDMCDSNENGLIDKLELQEMLTSLVEMAKTEKVLPEDVSRLIDSMFRTSGFEDKEVRKTTSVIRPLRELQRKCVFFFFLFSRS